MVSLVAHILRGLHADIPLIGDDSQLVGVWRMSSAGSEFVTPLGMLDDEGNIAPLPQDSPENIGSSSTEAALFKGVEEKVPRHVGQLVGEPHLRPPFLITFPKDIPTTNSEELTQTQCLDSTHRGSSPIRPPSASSSPLSSPEPPTPSSRRTSTISHSKYFRSNSLPPSDPLGLSVASSASFHEDQTVDTQLLKAQLISHQRMDEDTEMLGGFLLHSFD